ncbi:uncharacterized protein V6R79_006604 [Siganus canaliculatus]
MAAFSSTALTDDAEQVGPDVQTFMAQQCGCVAHLVNTTSMLRMGAQETRRSLLNSHQETNMGPIISGLAFLQSPGDFSMKKKIKASIIYTSTGIWSQTLDAAKTRDIREVTALKGGSKTERKRKTQFTGKLAEEEALHRHEALAYQALGASGPLKALRLRAPVVLAVGNPLSLGLHRSLAAGAFQAGGRKERRQCPESAFTLIF